MPLCDAHHTALIRAKASSFTPCSPPLPPSSAPLPPPFPQLVSHRFAQLLGHRRSLLSQRWLFGIADEFITKQLPHNVTWGLSLLFALEAPRGASEEGRMGARAHTDKHIRTHARTLRRAHTVTHRHAPLHPPSHACAHTRSRQASGSAARQTSPLALGRRE